MRHRKKTLKLGRKTAHRHAMLANLVSSLILHNRVTTTVSRAKAASPLADKMVTLGKKGDLHHKRQALAALGQPALVTQIAPKFAERNGGYTRVVRVGQRYGDAAHTAILEWVEMIAAPAVAAPAETKKDKKQKKAEAAAAKK
jgi:large subunit ribosomal protein L17